MTIQINVPCASDTDTKTTIAKLQQQYTQTLTDAQSNGFGIMITGECDQTTKLMRETAMNVVGTDYPIFVGKIPYVPAY